MTFRSIQLGITCSPQHYNQNLVYFMQDEQHPAVGTVELENWRQKLQKSNSAIRKICLAYSGVDLVEDPVAFFEEAADAFEAELIKAQSDRMTIIKKNAEPVK